MKEVIAVAMSGGVDSSLTAAMLLKQGYEVFGITLRLWVKDQEEDDVPPAVTDAKAMCDFLGIKHYVVDAKEIFKDTVVSYFVKEYSAGRTPNPCVHCNKHIKFGLLLQEAIKHGATHMVTGHYAQVKYNEETGLYELHKGADPSKDQSYVLYNVTQDVLSKMLFPLGAQCKTETRAIAREYGLPVADKPDSEDICFLPDKDYPSFLSARQEGAPKTGNIVLTDGTVLGKHEGLYKYTIGQRKGLGVAYAHPLYVVRLDSEKNEVVVGTNDDLFTKEMVCHSYNFISGTVPTHLETTGKIRYAAQPAPCVVDIADGCMTVRFTEGQRAITPGQSVVFYEGTQVLGGGIIDEVR